MIYANENHARTAYWLTQLPIAIDEVDTRSITEVESNDVEKFTQCHFFAGIGGWSRALQLAGWPTDVGVWTGSCPCQPFSSAGSQKAEKDERHLWPEFARLIDGCRPPIVFGEQVASKLGRSWLARVRDEMEALGYGFGAADLCAAGAGSPHIRQRLFWVAYLPSERLQRLARDVSDRNQSRRIEENTIGHVAQGGDVNGHPSSSRAQHEREPGRREATTQNGTITGGDHGRLVNSSMHNEGTGRRTGEQASSRRALNRGSSSDGSRVDDTTGARFQWKEPDTESDPREETRLRVSGVRRGESSWGVADYLYCTDGKYRPVEPGTFPLANGIPGRVAQLRGLGNAIVPELGALFIKSTLEALTDAAASY